jgi:N-acetyl-beta-hexosaminidase
MPALLTYNDWRAPGEPVAPKENAERLSEEYQQEKRVKNIIEYAKGNGKVSEATDGK